MGSLGGLSTNVGPIKAEAPATEQSSASGNSLCRYLGRSSGNFGIHEALVAMQKIKLNLYHMWGWGAPFTLKALRGKVGLPAAFPGPYRAGGGMVAGSE